MMTDRAWPKNTEDDQAEMLDEFKNAAEEFVRMTEERLGMSAVGNRLHHLIDEITSGAYGMEFAYCGRKHTVL